MRRETNGLGARPAWDVRARRGQRRVLHLPGGGTGGRAPEEAALRELDEETGVVAAEVRAPTVIGPLPATTTARTHLFL
ncbi:NUDIX domain-containing protein [Streptomyces sp. TRM S81-3]|uniref:NUDIX domain-containing protein n=1 Tax=Streptomyces griseicoloratus TaxID=2752516 RepID=A0A926KZA2_9ACTN|nr:NUDIX domain-containing protein [Streptomyces griseicoloratus]